MFHSIEASSGIKKVILKNQVMNGTLSLIIFSTSNFHCSKRENKKIKKLALF